MHEKHYHAGVERLRSPERLARLEVQRVVALTLDGLSGVKTLLDIGTGSGVFAEAFSATGLTVTGVDANPEMISVASNFVPGAIFKEAVAEKLPFKDGQFDLAFMGVVLHETDDPLTALQEARRVTTLRTAVLEWPDEDQADGPPLSQRLPAEKITALALQAGFKRVQSFRLDTLILFLLDN